MVLMISFQVTTKLVPLSLPVDIVIDQLQPSPDPESSPPASRYLQRHMDISIGLALFSLPVSYHSVSSASFVSAFITFHRIFGRSDRLSPPITLKCLIIRGSKRMGTNGTPLACDGSCGINYKQGLWHRQSSTVPDAIALNILPGMSISAIPAYGLFFLGFH